MTSAGSSMKDDLFNRDTVTGLALDFEKAGVFAAAPFVDEVMAGLAPLELKARISWIGAVLANHLLGDFPDAAAAILQALPPPLDPTKTDDDFGHFIYAPLGVYVENHGLAAHFDLSLDLLEAITQRFSMEFSIRAFINADPDAVLARMRQWAVSDNYHVRRLVSEGTRPKLPWGQSVVLTSAQTLPLLDMLAGDKTRFVTRSVANHLNDISKSDPDAVLDRLTQWQATGTQAVKEHDWMTRHALRGLIKAGHPGAMAQLGFAPDVGVVVTDFSMSPDDLARGDAAEIAVTLSVPKDAGLIVDYVVDFVKSNGKTAPKVFKWKTMQAKADVPMTLTKKHLFKGNATTFKLYPGAHRLHVQVNGRIVASLAFTLQ